jgi:O-antigen ligase
MTGLHHIVTSQRRGTYWVILALAATMMLGGGGVTFPLTEMVLQVFTASCFFLWFTGKGRHPAPQASWLCAVGVLLLPTLFLLPLPPALWHGLAGRAALADGLGLVGRQNEWHSLALFPAHALSSWISIAATALLIPMVAWLDRRGQILLFAVLVLVGVLSLMVGAIQIGVGEGNLFRFYYEADDYLVGFQGNRNHQADVLLLVLLVFGALLRGLHDFTQRGLHPWSVAVVVLCFDAACALGVVLTQSRTGMTLLPLVLVGQAYVLGPIMPWGKRPMRAAMILALALAIGAAFLMTRDGTIGAAMARFGQDHDQRPEIWTNSVNMIGQYHIIGAGYGSFLRLYEGEELLESVSDIFVIRAHNDYLEFFLENGLAGVVALIAISGILFLNRKRNAAATPLYIRAFALMGLAQLGLHSFVDYPLRTMALDGFAAISAGLLLAGSSQLQKSNALDGNA